MSMPPHLLFLFISFIQLFKLALSDFKPTITKGLIIDAGSGGSRLHIYNWKPRVFTELPPQATYPTTDEKWTGRMSPGISTLIGSPRLIEQHLGPLIDYARNTLVGHEKDFAVIPIFFKATGGMREVPLVQREKIMEYVRSFLSDKHFCPFYFSPEMARVISGEEEAVFSWAAVNFLMGTLVPAMEQSETGAAAAATYGTLDLGGSSTQIAFFVPSQDISEGLFKLHIGAQKHFNVYTKSFLQFGHNSARRRHVSMIADAQLANTKAGSADVPNAIDYCFFSGYSEEGYSSAYYASQTQTATPMSSPRSHKRASHSSSSNESSKSGDGGRRGLKPSSKVDVSTPVRISGPPVPAKDQFQRCMLAASPLLVKYNNDYCDIVYNGQCSINGAYQPTISPNMNFIGTSSYSYPWRILMLPPTASLDDYRKKAEYLCSLSFSEVLYYFEANNLNLADEKLGDLIPEYCFIVSYTYILLTEGYGFPLNQTITVLDQVNGNKVSWTLGAMMYEINTFPWTYASPFLTVDEHQHWALMCLSVAIGAIFGCMFTFVILREVHRDRVYSLADLAEDEDVKNVESFPTSYQAWGSLLPQSDRGMAYLEDGGSEDVTPQMSHLHQITQQYPFRDSSGHNSADGSSGGRTYRSQSWGAK